MKAYAHKSIDSGGCLTKHYVGKNDEGNIIYARRTLMPVKALEEYNIGNWHVLKQYRDKILIEKTIIFYPETAEQTSAMINQLLIDKND